MHNLLITLPPEKKKKWPQFLPDLVFVYNATPHSSTGLSPYYLMFGRDPLLPIDVMLGRIEPSAGSVDKWLETHAKNLFEASEIAGFNLQQSALARQKTYNKKARKAPLPIGCRVLVRNRVLGRNKIQDHWKPTPYKVIKKLQDNVYTIQCADGTGPTKNMNRRELLDTRELVLDTNSQDNVSDSQVRKDEITDLEEDDDTDLVGILVTQKKPNPIDTTVEDGESVHEEQLVDQEVDSVHDLHHEGDQSDIQDSEPEDNQEGATALDSDSSQEVPVDGDEEIESEAEPVQTEEVQPRRSTRTTAGIHSNPHRLPQSAIRRDIHANTEDKITEMMNTYTSAMLSLGQMLTDTMKESLQSCKK